MAHGSLSKCRIGLDALDDFLDFFKPNTCLSSLEFVPSSLCPPMPSLSPPPYTLPSPLQAHEVNVNLESTSAL